jgi:hypothetical protein
MNVNAISTSSLPESPLHESANDKIIILIEILCDISKNKYIFIH